MLLSTFGTLFLLPLVKVLGLALSPTRTSAITDHNSTALMGRGNLGGVNICADPDFKGECYYKVWPLFVCIDFASGPYSHSVPSFGPDPDTWCTIFNSGYCDPDEKGSRTLTTGYPGLANLADANFDDMIHSFICVEKPPAHGGPITFDWNYEYATIHASDKEMPENYVILNGNVQY